MRARSLLRWLGGATFLAIATGCGADDHASKASLDDQSGREMGSSSDGCAAPNTGCDCDDEGARVACGTVKEQVGNYTLCSKGERVCSSGAWSACGPIQGEPVEVSSSDADAGVPPPAL